MSILTEKRTWKRKRPPERFNYRKLTPTQSANVRRVLAHLTIEMGGRRNVAAALNVSLSLLEKATSPGRGPGVRHALMVARLAGVGVDDVVAGRWKRHACERCGCIGVA